jgi:hypothetical protein
VNVPRLTITDQVWHQSKDAVRSAQQGHDLLASARAAALHACVTGVAHRAMGVGIWLVGICTAWPVCF